MAKSKHFFDEKGMYIGSASIGSLGDENSTVIENNTPYYSNKAKLVGDDIVVTYSTLSMAEGRERLRLSGFLKNIDELISKLPSDEKERASIWWEYGTSIDRENEETKMIAAALWPDDSLRENVLDILYSVNWDRESSPKELSILLGDNNG